MKGVLCCWFVYRTSWEVGVSSVRGGVCGKLTRFVSRGVESRRSVYLKRFRSRRLLSRVLGEMVPIVCGITVSSTVGSMEGIKSELRRRLSVEGMI